MLKPDTYVPSLRWRLAEKQALFRLSTTAKDRVVPFVTVTKPEYNFEKGRMARTVQEQVEPFAREFNNKWGSRPAWVDFQRDIESELLADGKLPVVHVFDKLHDLGSGAVPVLGLASPIAVREGVAAIANRDGRGVGVRLGFVDIMKPDCGKRLSALLAGIGVLSRNACILVDLVAPTYEPYSDFADGLIAALEGLGDLAVYRSFVLIGSAFPASVELPKPGGELIRHDWKFYQVFCQKLEAGARVPTYGDYTTVAPSFAADVDFRKFTIPGKIIYTTNGTWMVRKGGSFNNDREQMHGHCADIVTSGQFRGAAFSFGDDYIEQCGKRLKGPSNQPFWKQVAISHHIVHVLDDLAKSSAAA